MNKVNKLDLNEAVNQREQHCFCGFKSCRTIKSLNHLSYRHSFNPAASTRVRWWWIKKLQLDFFYIQYLFDLSLMLICIQSYRHLSKKPIVTLLAMATSYLKCANLTPAQCRIHIKMSLPWLIVFISDSEYYYCFSMIKNKNDTNQCEKGIYDRKYVWGTKGTKHCSSSLMTEQKRHCCELIYGITSV